MKSLPQYGVYLSEVDRKPQYDGGSNYEMTPSVN
jgi:hypothetical protein